MLLPLYALPLKKASKHIVQYAIINGRLRKVAATSEEAMPMNDFVGSFSILRKGATQKMQDYGIYLLVCIIGYVNGVRLLVKSLDHLLADSLSAMQNLSQLIDEIDDINKKLELRKQQKSRHDDDN